MLKIKVIYLFYLIRCLNDIKYMYKKRILKY